MKDIQYTRGDHLMYRNNKRRKTKGLFLGILLCILFTACGGGGGGDDERTPPPTVSPQPTPPQDTAPTFALGTTIDDQNYINGVPITPLDLPEATGGNAPLRYSITGLPMGLELTGNQVTGTPTEVVSGQTVTYTARDTDGDEDTLMFNVSVRAPNFCDRTQQVEDAILAKIHETDPTVTCDTVTEQHLADITGTINLNSRGITSLQADDFDGLSSLDGLVFQGNRLMSLPEEVFDGLSSLSELDLARNRLTTLPADIFDGLSSLSELSLGTNMITTLPADVFDGLTSLTRLILSANSLTTLPADVFDGLSSLITLGLNDNNDIATLPADVFDGLSSLMWLDLRGVPAVSVANPPAICIQPTVVNCQL